MTMPEAVFFSSSRRLTITRSCNGRTFIGDSFWTASISRDEPPHRALERIASAKCDTERKRPRGRRNVRFLLLILGDAMNIATWMLSGALVGWLGYSVLGFNQARGKMVSLIIG